MTYSRGTITIDGVDILSLDLDKLRSSFSVIPQEPVLFTGSLRDNLDPFSNHSDSSLWEALQEVQLASLVTNMEEGLQTQAEFANYQGFQNSAQRKIAKYLLFQMKYQYIY